MKPYLNTLLTYDYTLKEQEALTKALAAVSQLTQEKQSISDQLEKTNLILQKAEQQLAANDRLVQKEFGLCKQEIQ